jgi:hypothetical protein
MVVYVEDDNFMSIKWNRDIFGFKIEEIRISTVIRNDVCLTNAPRIRVVAASKNLLLRYISCKDYS